MNDRRTIISGIGIVAANGVGAESFWEATQRGVSGIRRIDTFDISRYPMTLAGQVRNFSVRDYVDGRLRMRTDRWTWLALAATQMAFTDANFNPAEVDPYKISVVMSSSSGGNEAGQIELQKLWGKGPGSVSAYLSIIWFYAGSTGQVSIQHGLKGPACVIANEAAGGLDAIAHARRTVRRGSNIAVTGGTEAPITPYALTAQYQNGRLSTATVPEDGYRPFDTRANGYVSGEGGAILVMEELEHALARGAPQIYGEIVGHGATHDAYHPSKAAPDSRQYARAIELALERAGMTPAEVDVIFPDAIGTLDGDELELDAIRAVFGEKASTIPMSVPKSMYGRLQSGAGPLDVATALLALRDQIIPPTINLNDQASTPYLDIVTGRARPASLTNALILARGFGGFNSALVVRKFGDA